MVAASLGLLLCPALPLSLHVLQIAVLEPRPPPRFLTLNPARTLLCMCRRRRKWKRALRPPRPLRLQSTMRERWLHARRRPRRWVPAEFGVHFCGQLGSFECCLLGVFLTDLGIVLGEAVQ